jgi:hypothetical protein
MPNDQPEKEPATIQSVVKQIRSATPNTVISGSIGDGGGGVPIDDSAQSAQKEAPHKSP